MAAYVGRSADRQGFRIFECKNLDQDAANQYLDAVEVKGLSKHTVRSYAFDMLLIERWLLNFEKPFTDLTSADLIQFIKWQKANDAQPNSINRRLITIRTLYQFVTGKQMVGGKGEAFTAGYYRGRGRDKNLGINALHRLGRINLKVKVPRKLVDPLTPDQVQEFLKKFTRYRDISIVYLMLFCGLRTQEVLNLRLQDLNYEDSRCKVLGKGTKERVLPLADIVVKPIKKYLTWERPPETQTKHLFVALQGNRRGKAMTPAGIRSLFRHRGKRGNLDVIHPHRFRHTFGADMARAGVHLPILQKMMGHADTATTMIYVNLSLADVTKEFDAAMAKIEHRYLDRIF